MKHPAPKPSLPTEILIQKALEARKSIRLRIGVEIYTVEGRWGQYEPIQASRTYIEVSNPGLVWKIVANVVQGCKRLELEEKENVRPDEWFTIVPRPRQTGRPKGSLDVVPRGKRNIAGEEPDTTDEEPFISPDDLFHEAAEEAIVLEERLNKLERIYVNPIPSNPDSD